MYDQILIGAKSGKMIKDRPIPAFVPSTKHICLFLKNLPSDPTFLKSLAGIRKPYARQLQMYTYQNCANVPPPPVASDTKNRPLQSVTKGQRKGN